MSYRARLLAIIGLALAATAIAAGALIAIVGTADAAQRVILVAPDGARLDCGSMRQNRRQEWVWRVRVPCGPLATPAPAPTACAAPCCPAWGTGACTCPCPHGTASPGVTPRPTASPSVTPRPTATAVDACAGGCWVHDFETRTTACVRPCP